MRAWCCWASCWSWVVAATIGCGGPTTQADAGADAGESVDAARRLDSGPSDAGPPPTGCDRLDAALDGSAEPIDDGGVIDPAAFPPARGPGGPRTTFSGDQLTTLCGHMDLGATDQLHHNTGFMLDGYLVRAWAHEHGGGGVAVLEIDEPCAPEIVANTLDDQIRETHATGYSTVGGRWIATASLAGVMFWDVSDITAPERVFDLTLPGVSYPDAYMRVVLSIAWQAPYLYAGAGDNGIYVVDATDPLAPRVVTQLEPAPRFRVGNVHVVGNLLIAMGAGNSRVALFDVSVPEAPRPIPGGSFIISDGTVDRFGRPLATTAYFGMVGGGRSYHARNGLGGGLAIYDLSSPSTPRFLGNVDAPGGDGGYVFLHEGLAFVGQSDYGCIYDVSDPTMPREIRRVEFPGDLDTITPLGNVMMVSVDDDAVDGHATGIFPWAEQPDARGPRVDWVVPADGATAQAVTSRVGITFDEFVAMESIWRGSFQVRELGTTTPVDGWYSGQDGVVNFWPRAPLRPGTTYEVIVPAGGVTDISGNPTTSDFRAAFTTETCGG